MNPNDPGVKIAPQDVSGAYALVISCWSLQQSERKKLTVPKQRDHLVTQQRKEHASLHSERNDPSTNLRLRWLLAFAAAAGGALLQSSLQIDCLTCLLRTLEEESLSRSQNPMPGKAASVSAWRLRRLNSYFASL